MGIIGIVSALTLPNLNSSTGEKEKVAKVKKIYQNMNDALGRATAVYGPVDEWMTSSESDRTSQQAKFGNRLTEFMKVSKSCGTTANQGCWAKTGIKYSNGTTWSSVMSDTNSERYKFILADGTSVLGGTFWNTGLLIDIDGPNKGKNQLGTDVFYFVFDDDKTSYMPYGYNYDFSNVLASVKSGGSGFYSTAWVVNYDNMDYLKLTSDGKCPNGTTPTEENPRCK